MKWDFIEIGTSDFDTELQRCPDDAYGLSIDPLSMYLENLPSKDHVHKVCAAITGSEPETDTIDIFYVHPTDIVAHKLPMWVRGCNSIGNPHPTTSSVLQTAGLSHLMQHKSVPLLSLAHLFRQYEVDTIGKFKVDTEGHDCNIVTGLIRYCETHESVWPKVLVFEYNSLTDRNEADAVIRSLKTNGYDFVSHEGDEITFWRS